MNDLSLNLTKVDRVSTQDEVRLAMSAPGMTIDDFSPAALPQVCSGDAQELLLELSEHEFAYVVDLLTRAGELVH